MLGMYDESILNSYMIQVRMQAIAGSLGEQGYANELIIRESETPELRVEAPGDQGIFSVKYEIIFGDDGEMAVGFVLKLYHADETASDDSEPLAVRTEKLALDSDKTALWIIDHMH